MKAAKAVSDSRPQIRGHIVLSDSLIQIGNSSSKLYSRYAVDEAGAGFQRHHYEAATSAKLTAVVTHARPSRTGRRQRRPSRFLVSARSNNWMASDQKVKPVGRSIFGKGQPQNSRRHHTRFPWHSGARCDFPTGSMRKSASVPLWRPGGAYRASRTKIFPE